MNMVPKINNDSESRRMQRNMTDTQKRNANNVKEGKLVNAFVKDPQLSLDETIDTLVISHEKIDLPQKVFEKEEKKNNGIYYLAGASLGIMGLLGGFTAMIKVFQRKNFNLQKNIFSPELPEIIVSITKSTRVFFQ